MGVHDIDRSAVRAKSANALQLDVRPRSITRSLGDDRVWIVATAAILLLQLALVLGHEPWLDEWQALLVAAQSPDLAALLRALRYEGHPPLWYLLLRGASAVLPPRAALMAVQLPIAAGIQMLILFASPFPRWQRLLIASGFFVLIDYGAIARSLGLGVLLTLLAVASRHRRIGWLAIALLPSADMLFGLFSIGFVADRLASGRAWRPGLALWAMAAIFSALSIVPAADMQPAFAMAPSKLALLASIWRLGSVLMPLETAGGLLVWNRELPPVIGLPAGLLFLRLSWHVLARRTVDRTVFALFAAFVALFGAFVYPLAIRHLSLLGWLLILLRWRAEQEGAPPSRMFAAWLAAGSLCGIGAAATALSTPFDTAPAAAAFIGRHRLSGRHWVVVPDAYGLGVSARSGMGFERLGSGCTQTMVRWSARPRFQTIAEVRHAMLPMLARHGHSYVLSGLALDGAFAPFQVRLLAHVPAGYDGQSLFLYEAAYDVPEHGPAVPPCVLGLRPLRAWSRDD